MPRITWRKVRASRLRLQHLLERAPRKRMLDVIGDVCGVHAQVQSSAELQIWARVKGTRVEDVREALWEERSLVRTWAMRGTLHLLPSRDLPLYVAALRTHDRWWKGAWLRMIGMGAEDLRATLDAIHDSLGRRPLTREQLADKVAERVGAAERARLLSGWGEMLKPAAFEGSLASGPPRGGKVTFVRPDRWLRGAEGWDGMNEPPADEAWREIVRRYLRAYGPATREELGRWWGMQPAPAGRILAASGDEVVEVDVEGTRAWALEEDLDAMGEPASKIPVRLLPGFDVYVAGTRPRSSLVDPRFEDRVFRTAGWVSAVVLVDGMIAGVWEHERAGKGLEIVVEPFRKLTAAQKGEIAAEAEGLGRFLGAPAAISYRG